MLNGGVVVSGNALDVGMGVTRDGPVGDAQLKYCQSRQRHNHGSPGAGRCGRAGGQAQARDVDALSQKWPRRPWALSIARAVRVCRAAQRRAARSCGAWQESRDLDHTCKSHQAAGSTPA